MGTLDSSQHCKAIKWNEEMNTLFPTLSTHRIFRELLVVALVMTSLGDAGRLAARAEVRVRILRIIEQYSL